MWNDDLPKNDSFSFEENLLPEFLRNEEDDDHIPNMKNFENSSKSSETKFYNKFSESELYLQSNICGPRLSDQFSTKKTTSDTIKYQDFEKKNSILSQQINSNNIQEFKSDFNKSPNNTNNFSINITQFDSQNLLSSNNINNYLNLKKLIQTNPQKLDKIEFSTNNTDTLSANPNRLTNIRHNSEVIIVQPKNLNQYSLVPEKGKKVKSKTSLLCSNYFDKLNEEMKEIEFMLNYNQIISYLKTNRGSLAMQNYLDRISKENLEILIQKIEDNYRELLIDPFANYFMKKLIKLCSSKQKISILEKIKENFVEICNNSSGSHSMQILIENITTIEEEELLKNYLENNLIRLANNSNGIYILHKLILIKSQYTKDYVYNFIIENVRKLSLNTFGTSFMKKFISINDDIRTQEIILEKITEISLELIQDSFGNYLVQFVFEFFGTKKCCKILEMILFDLVNLSTQKFSSNVVERVIEQCDKTIFNIFVNQLFFNSENFMVLLKNKYGIYVLQKLISLMNHNEKLFMKNHLLKNISCSGNKEKKRFSILVENFFCNSNLYKKSI